MTKKSILTLAILLVIVAGAVAAFRITGSQQQSQTGKLTVAASYYPLYDFATKVGGDKVAVTNITPAGTEPHDFEPSAKDIMSAQESTVFIYNGGLMEPWVPGFLSDYTHVTVKASQGIDLKNLSEDGENGKQTVQDPHFWLDPVLAQQIVKNIRDGFIKADPAHKSYYTANAESYNHTLAELDTRFASGLSRCTLDTVISSHEAFSYLATRYHFKVDSIAGIEPSEEPSPARMAELTDLVRQKGIRYIFFESLISPRLAETIASETGAKTLVFNPIEGLSKQDQIAGKEYVSVQYDNLKNLKKALECGE